ncbi:MAG: hypothetical protein D4R65_10940 [Verrucomicrobiaceae bacterium]|nr:MAG: hypothetical protein D4R65_10940 [Verrucomicrobiaceae bacterium]
MKDIAPILKRFDAWYANDMADRPPVTFMWVGRDDAPPPDLEFDPKRCLVDGAFRLSLFEKMLPLRAFPGDSFPMFSGGITADHNGTVFGLKLDCSRESVWAVHFLENVRDAMNLEFSFDNPYWASMREATDLSLERGNGKWITTLCCHGGVNGDILVALRGPENLCMDVMDDPEGVRLAANRLSSFYPKIYDDIRDRLLAHDSPVTAEGELSRRRTGRIGCDFLCLLSEQMARDTVYESIESDINSLEQCYFHLDSEGSLRHLDFILGQPRVAGIQWVYGVNRGPAVKWADVYTRIQKAGKALEVLPVDVPDALALMKHLEPEGVWFKFLDSLKESEAEYFMGEVGKRSNWR